MRPSRRWRRVALIGAAAALVVPGTPPAGAASVQAVAPGDPARDARAAASQAQARAAAAALEVERLTLAYVGASGRARAGLSALADAWSVSAEADRSADGARQGLASARAERSRRVRALYVMGGSATLAASVLAAESPEDALWRTATVRRVLEGLVERSQDAVAAGDDAVASTRRAQLAADDGLTARVGALDGLEADAVAAQQALAAAHAVLAALDEQARRADVAARAAAALAAAQAAQEAARRAATASVSAAGIPAEFAVAYRDFAGTCPGMRWTLLAAVGQVESGHGRNNGPSSAGALGPMQFMPATFAAYGVDGGGDGVAEITDPRDAVASAANYLCASGIDGTPQGDQRALLAYNHAQWYVDLVLDAEAAIIVASASQVTAGAPAEARPAVPAPTSSP